MAGYGNIFAQGMDAFDDSYARTQKGFDKATSRRAGQALAAGDRTGAANIFANQGMIGEARQLENDQTNAETLQFNRDRLETQDKRQTRQDELAERKLRADHFKQITGAMRQIPWGEQGEGAAKRLEFLKAALPILKQETGVDTTPYEALTPDQLSDQNLTAFDGEIDKIIGVPLGGGGYGAYNATKGTFKTLREPTQRAPAGMEFDEDGNLRNIPGYVPARREVAGATRAPPRPRAGGGGGGGLSSMKTEDLIAALRR